MTTLQGKSIQGKFEVLLILFAEILALRSHQAFPSVMSITGVLYCTCLVGKGLFSLLVKGTRCLVSCLLRFMYSVLDKAGLANYSKI